MSEKLGIQCRKTNTSELILMSRSFAGCLNNAARKSDKKSIESFGAGTHLIPHGGVGNDSFVQFIMLGYIRRLVYGNM